MANRDYVRNEISDFLIDLEEDNPECAKAVISDLVRYSLFIMSLDGKVTAKEAQFLAEVIGITIKQSDLSEASKKLDWDEFCQVVPNSTKMLINLDNKFKNKWDDSLTHNLIMIYAEIGNLMLEEDPSTKKHKGSIENYLVDLTNYATGNLTSEKKEVTQKRGDKDKEVSKKNENSIAAYSKAPVSPPKKEIPANTGKVSKNTSAKASEHVSSSGGWVKASQYMPTGNFLDDAFRHQGLTHEDRIAIWAQITTESLPCQYNSDMEYKESAWFGRTEADASPICSVLDSAEMSNKPVYYYSVGFSQSPNMAVYSPAGIMIMHQGIIIHWNQEDMIVMPWDFVSSVKNIKEDEKTYKLVLKVDDEIDLHTEKEGLMFIFPKPGSMPGMDFPEKSELMNLVKLIKTRLKQLEPYRDKPFCIENDDWYFNLTEEVARKLCEEYILKKSKSDTPRTSSKGNVIPPQATKPQKTEKQSVDTQPQPLKKFEPLQPDKPPFKPVSGASQPTGPVTFLEFWQALKPVLDKLKFKGLSNVKLTENDWLNCKANIIVGVYHSIGILKTKKKIRLDCYIDTGNEVGNLQIIDYVQSKIKPVKTIKDRLVFDRKEGRRAQRIALFLDNFDLDNRNCWNTYIKEIADIMDDFVAAIDTCLKDL